MVKKTKKRQNNNKIKKSKVFLLVVILVMSVGALYLIKGTDMLLPKINQVTASYISFNNSNTTDMLKINNIKKRYKRVGKSFINTESTAFDITGTKEEPFSIELYSIGNTIDKKYLNYILLENNKTISTGKLNELAEKENGGIILYQDKIKDDNHYQVRLWIDKDYKEEANNISYEIKIQSR